MRNSTGKTEEVLLYNKALEQYLSKHSDSVNFDELYYPDIESTFELSERMECLFWRIYNEITLIGGGKRATREERPVSTWHPETTSRGAEEATEGDPSSNMRV